MASRRELILDRLLQICKTIVAPDRASRNRNDISGRTAHSIVLHDGPETTDAEKGEKPRRGQVASSLECAVMSPTLEFLANDKPETIGTLLNDYRDRIIVAVINDVELRTICGASYGLIRYAGCVPDTESGEASEGRIDVNFQINYPVVVSEL